MAVKIRLKRMGKIRTPFYRIVVADSRTKRDGRVIEEIGTYNPKTEPSTINVVSERAQYWLSVGAQPTEAVAAILKITGDIGGKASLKTPEAKTSKEDLFNEALKDLHNAPKTEATTAKKKADKKADDKKADEKPADEKPADEAPAADETAETEVPAEAEASTDEKPSEDAS